MSNLILDAKQVYVGLKTVRLPNIPYTFILIFSRTTIQLLQLFDNGDIGKEEKEIEQVGLYFRS